MNNSRFFSTESIVANVQDVRFPVTPDALVEVAAPSSLAIMVLGALGLALGRVKKQA